MDRGDLSDAEWELIGPLLPPERGRHARPAGDNRRYLNGMLHVLRVGCPWRDMHERYGKWNSVYVRFRRCDNQGLPLDFQLTGGEASDYGGVDSLMAMPVPKPAALLADKGYDGDRFRENLLLHNILPVIPPRSNRKAPEHPDYRRYRDRNRVERMFGFLKHQRRIATRFEKTALSYLSFLNLAAARLWLKHFLNAT